MVIVRTSPGGGSKTQMELVVSVVCEDGTGSRLLKSNRSK